MKAVSKKLLSLMLVAILLVSAVPFQASATETQPAETAAATEAAVVAAAETEAPVAETEAKIEADVPAANAEIVEKQARFVEFQVSVNESQPYRVGNLVKTKIGSKVSTPSEKAVLSVVKAITGSSAGYKLVRWELASTGETFTSSTTINLSMEPDSSYPENDKDDADEIPCIEVNAIVEYVAKEITLKPNGGTVAETKHTVEIGRQYDYYGGLPTPSRSNYSFAGWFKEDGTEVTNETIVSDLSTLTAKWSGNKYTVVFEGYDGEWAEVGFGSFSVDPNSVLKTAYSNFPSDQQIKSLFLAPVQEDGWRIDGWEISVDDGDTWKTFTAGKTKITGNATIRPLYKKSITLYADDEGNTTRTLTVTLGKKIPALPNPGSRDGLTFMGWKTEDESVYIEKSKLSDVSSHEKYTIEMGDLHAVWEESVRIKLYIFTDGDTDDHTKMVNYYDAPATGFDLTQIDLADIFASYGKYDDEGDKRYGWYDAEQWENYCLKKPANEFEYVDADYLASDDIHSFYIMLIDKGNNSGNGSASAGSSGANSSYKDNNKVDKTNPTTGDNIMMTVSVMTASAAALALVFFLNKKRTIV